MALTAACHALCCPGRASEEINFGSITTGAADDLDKVTQMAYSMVTIYGMNEAIGQLSFPPKGEMQFDKPYSDATARMIDDEVRKIVDGAYQRTKQLLTKQKDAVVAVAELLLKQETINQAEVKALVGARPFETSVRPQARLTCAAWLGVRLRGTQHPAQCGLGCLACAQPQYQAFVDAAWQEIEPTADGDAGEDAATGESEATTSGDGESAQDATSAAAADTTDAPAGDKDRDTPESGSKQ